MTCFIYTCKQFFILKLITLSGCTCVLNSASPFLILLIVVDFNSGNKLILIISLWNNVILIHLKLQEMVIFLCSVANYECLVTYGIILEIKTSFRTHK